MTQTLGLDVTRNGVMGVVRDSEGQWSMIDPAEEAADAIAAIRKPTVGEVASARGHDWRELYSKYVIGNRPAVSPVIDMIPHPTDQIVVRVPAEYQIRKIDIADDDGFAVHYAPHPTGDGFPDYAGQLLQTIVSNLGIPAEILSAQDTNFASTGASESLRVFNERMEVFGEQMREFFRPAVLSLYKIMVQTSDAFFAAACLLYREQVGRLPGSERTSRLRKKRRDRVLDWYLNTYLPGDQE